MLTSDRPFVKFRHNLGKVVCYAALDLKSVIHASKIKSGGGLISHVTAVHVTTFPSTCVTWFLVRM